MHCTFLGRPCYWSSEEQRVLSEDEIEHKSRLGQAHLVKFKVKSFGEGSQDLKKLGKIEVVAFCNEPWKLVSTQALAVDPEGRYALVKEKDKKFVIVALDRVGELAQRTKNKDFTTQFEAPGIALQSLTLEHPLFPDREISIV